MRLALAWINILNAALFFFGAVQHAGVALGPLHEPRIVSAAIVEGVCGIGLTWAAMALFRTSPGARRAAWIANFIALAGVVLGMVALAMGAGPRTASNDLYHRLMLALIAISMLLLSVLRAQPSRVS